MKKPALPRVIAADIFNGDVLIAFEDERTVFFPAAFLYQAIPQVREIFDCGPDEDTELVLNAGGADAR
jgi:hypothetical protein